MLMRLLFFAFLLLSLAACDQDGQHAAKSQGQGVTVSEGMGGQPDPGFSRAIHPRKFNFPADHVAHEEYATEWWYFTGNLQDISGRPFGYQLTIFRIGLEPGKPVEDSKWRAHQVYMGHLAISDIQSGQHESAEIFSRAALGLAGSSSNPIRIWLGPWSIQSESADLFPLNLAAQSEDLAINLQITQGDKPVILQGNQGLSQKGAEPGNASYYYSYTRLPTSGKLSINKKSFQVSGNSWFDREWSSSALADDQQGWDWFALQLDDGRDLMFYRMRDKQGKAQQFSRGVLVDVDGQSISLSLANTRLVTKQTWQSPQGDFYPLKWKLQVKELGLDLDIEAVFEDQLMQHTVTYWEGAVTVTGSHSGRGYMELSGYANSN